MNFRLESEMLSRKFAEVQARRGRRLIVRNPADVFALLIATGGGAGFAPFVPATFGSAVGIVVVLFLVAAFKSSPGALPLGILLSSAGLALLGVWAAARSERIFRKKDAGQIVIDEVCGQLITFLFVAPALTGHLMRAATALFLGFLLFRLFDIFKPYPCRQLESLGSGLGVMADDVVAGLYAAMALWLAHILTLKSF